MRNFNTRFILSLIIFSFIPILIFSQSTQTIVLNGTDSGTKNYVARDEVVFNAGYNYTPTSGNTMSASTNPELVCNTIYIPLEDAPDTHDRELDKNLEVGTTNGAFGVSPSGGATYQIAIYTPPGTNGVQPQIAIAYNSQSGTGLLGRGWNISGLSAITRVPQNQYFDGQVYMINFDENDRFALDGSRLILNTGNYGEDGSTYKTEQENFAIITYFKNISTGKDYFKVENRDGSVVEYGNTVDSNVSEPDYPILYRINRITDAFGNYISYSYYLESLESYIKKIEYTGNSNVNQLPYQSLEFIYEKKTDQRDYKFAGKIIPETVILNNILVKSNNNVIRKYNFHYSLDVYSKLISIDEFNSENDKYNSTIIKWEEINKTTDASVIQALTNINSQAPTVYKYWSTGDVNGDGLTDILSFSYLPPNIGYLPETFIQVYENQTTNPLNPSFVETEGYTTPTNIESFFTHDFPLQGQALVHNLNGDNDPDIVIPFHHHTSNINSFKLFVLKESANVPTFSSTLNISSSSMPAYTFGDLNGDGIDDLVYIEKWGDLRGFGKIRFGSSNPLEEWNNEFGWNNLNLSMGLESAAQSISIEDFDSDGLNDIICFTNYGYKVLKNLGNNQFYQIEGSS